MLAAIALCLGTTILLKMHLGTPANVGTPVSGLRSAELKVARPVLSLVTLVPLVWLLAVTMTAGLEKLFHRDPRIGFLSQAKVLSEKMPALETSLAQAKAAGLVEQIGDAEKAVIKNRVQRFNNILDAVVAGIFLFLVATIVVLSAREWILLLRRRKPSVLKESEPVLLPDYAVAEGRATNAAGVAAIGFALLKELSGEAHLARERAAAECVCRAPDAREEKKDVKIYLAATERRFSGVRRCC